MCKPLLEVGGGLEEGREEVAEGEFALGDVAAEHAKTYVGGAVADWKDPEIAGEVVGGEVDLHALGLEVLDACVICPDGCAMVLGDHVVLGEALGCEAICSVGTNDEAGVVGGGRGDELPLAGLALDVGDFGALDDVGAGVALDEAEEKVVEVEAG